jgi:hypothetical protein
MNLTIDEQAHRIYFVRDQYRFQDLRPRKLGIPAAIPSRLYLSDLRYL